MAFRELSLCKNVLVVLRTSSMAALPPKKLGAPTNGLLFGGAVPRVTIVSFFMGGGTWGVGVGNAGNPRKLLEEECTFLDKIQKSSSDGGEAAARTEFASVLRGSPLFPGPAQSPREKNSEKRQRGDLNCLISRAATARSRRVVAISPVT